LKDNYLKIEAEHAFKSDIVVIFLGSPGTFAELGAFAMDEKIRSKLVIFNERKHEKENSFINSGPLKWLKKEQTIWYEKSLSSTEEIYRHLDYLVANIRFDKRKKSYIKIDNLGLFGKFDNYLLTISLFIYGSSTMKELIKRTYLSEKRTRDALRELITNKIVRARKLTGQKESVFEASVYLDDLNNRVFSLPLLSKLHCHVLASS
jgi:hypothetical protein